MCGADGYGREWIGVVTGRAMPTPGTGSVSGMLPTPRIHSRGVRRRHHARGQVSRPPPRGRRSRYADPGDGVGERHVANPGNEFPG